MFSALASNAFLLLEMMLAGRLWIDSTTYGLPEQYTLVNSEGQGPT